MRCKREKRETVPSFDFLTVSTAIKRGNLIVTKDKFHFAGAHCAMNEKRRGEQSYSKVMGFDA